MHGCRILKKKKKKQRWGLGRWPVGHCQRPYPYRHVMSSVFSVVCRIYQLSTIGPEFIFVVLSSVSVKSEISIELYLQEC